MRPRDETADESAQAPRQPRSRHTTYTTRAAVLALVVCALAVTLAYPARLYFSQRGQIKSLATQTAQQQAHVEALQKQAKADADPDHTAQQARERLYYAEPGEQLLLVPPKTGAARRTSPASGVAPVTAGKGTWYGRLWQSAVAAAAPSR